MRTEPSNMIQFVEKENVPFIYANKSNRQEPETLAQENLILPKLLEVESSFAEQAYRTFDRRIIQS